MEEMFVWALASLGFSFYLSNFADYGAVYGSLGAAIALLVYLYLSAVVLLLGAEVNEAKTKLFTATLRKPQLQGELKVT
jgi:YihY family inner membrane protein